MIKLKRWIAYDSSSQAFKPAKQVSERWDASISIADDHDSKGIDRDVESQIQQLSGPQTSFSEPENTKPAGRT